MKCIVKKPPEDFGHFSALPLPLYWKFHWPVDSMGEYSLDERKRNKHPKASIYWVGQQVCLGFSVLKNTYVKYTSCLLESPPRGRKHWPCSKFVLMLCDLPLTLSQSVDFLRCGL